jgi:hypothetical protein
MGNENIFAFDSNIGKYSVGAGLLVHKATSSSHLYFKGSFEFPEDVTVKWRKSDESIVEKTVPVKSHIPKEFRTDRDEIIFNIFPDDTVKLSFVIQTGEYTCKEIDTEGKLVDYGNKKQEERTAEEKEQVPAIDKR